MSEAGQTAVEEVSIQQLERIVWKLSRQIIEITTQAESGHPSSSLSTIDILVALYFGGIMRYKPENPDWPDRDRFILSKGHGAPGLYVTLAEAGYFNPDLLPTLRQLESPLEGHPNMRALPALEASTGSLGQGLSIAVGHALAGRLDGRDHHVYVMIGDGEIDEGQVWEATMSAAKFGLDNLTAILDYNQFQQTGPVAEVMPSLLPYADKWRSFGWHVQQIDGHELPQILEALHTARDVPGQPHMLVASTLKGKGLTAFERDDTNRMHGEPLSPEQAEGALDELDKMYAHATEA